jgi:hypothetical protein
VCAQHQRLIAEVDGAWAALSSFRDQMPRNPTAEQTEELSRLTGIAANTSRTLNAHIKACPECKKPSPG